MIMAKAEYQHTITDFWGTEHTIGYCSKCEAKVSRSAHGIDEECPECGEYIDWWEGSEADE